MKNSNKPAFSGDSEIKRDSNNELYPESIGLTKREYFAGLAMQGLMASMVEMRANGQSINMHGGICENLAIECVDMADALLEELAKSK